MLTGLATALARAWPGYARRRLLLPVAWTVSVALLIVAPANLVMQAALASIENPSTIWRNVFWALGGVCWTWATLAYQRRTGPGCDRCGRVAATVVPEPDNGDHRRAAVVVPAPRWVRVCAYLAAGTALLGFSLPHWLWAKGVPFGTEEAGRMHVQARSALWVLGIVPALGAVLTVGLVRRWGQRFPRWIPLLGGRRVPRWLALVPASVVGLLLVQYGAMMTRCVGGTLLGATDQCYNTGRPYLVRNWAITGTYLVFLVWGAMLCASTVGYFLMTRRRCTTCGHR
jgi:hypothetical protein